MGLTPYFLLGQVLQHLQKPIPAPHALAAHQPLGTSKLASKSYLHLLEYRMVLNPRKQHSHGICAVVKEWNASTIQVAGQLMDVCL